MAYDIVLEFNIKDFSSSAIYMNLIKSL